MVEHTSTNQFRNDFEFYGEALVYARSLAMEEPHSEVHILKRRTTLSAQVTVEEFEPDQNG